MVTIKKYSNRRLYDTSTSSYVTLEELADKIRRGTDVQVIDAESDEDITQDVLAQIILESRGAAQLLPVPLLMRLIRMGDDRLAEFFGQFMSWSLEMYLRFKEGAETMTPYNPFGGARNENPANMFGGPEAFVRMFMNQVPWSPGAPPWKGGDEVGGSGSGVADASPAPPPDEETGAPPTPDEQEADVEELRAEIDELKNLVETMQNGDSDESD